MLLSLCWMCCCCIDIQTCFPRYCTEAAFLDVIETMVSSLLFTSPPLTDFGGGAPPPRRRGGGGGGVGVGVVGW